jgi:hypothetical protein
MEEQDAVCVTIGVTPQIISAIHRVEWHCRDVIDYRFPKLIAGQVRHGGRETPLEEQLFVRRLDLPVRNDFDAVWNRFHSTGFARRRSTRVTLASVGTKSIVNTLVPIVRERPISCWQKRRDNKRHGHKRAAMTVRSEEKIAQIRAVVTEELGKVLRGLPADFTAQTPLMSSGILNSFAALELGRARGAPWGIAQGR